jgi:predicted Holliday junction resolvase-like endonuclease
MPANHPIRCQYLDNFEEAEAKKEALKEEALAKKAEAKALKEEAKLQKAALKLAKQVQPQKRKAAAKSSSAKRAGRRSQRMRPARKMSDFEYDCSDEDAED